MRWQTALEDVGPAGVDKGKGGKYLILPPGYKGTTPEGYIALPSPTYRATPCCARTSRAAAHADVAKAVAYGKRVKVYPLSQAENPPATTFVDAIDVVFDSTIPYDLRFFQALDRFVQYEPWIDRDRAMIDMLKSIGIEKGKPFDPDPATQAVLKDAIGEARAWLDNRYEATFTTSFNEGQQWALPAFAGARRRHDDQLRRSRMPIRWTARGVAYSMAFFSAKHLGAGQYYLMTIRDKDGKPFDGSGTYRLNVPANAPVKLYWSATVYDRATHALIRDQPLFKPRVDHAGLAEERRRLGGRLFRSQGAGRQGVELGADQRGWKVRSAVPSLRPGEAVLRQDVGAAGHREDRSSRRTTR